MEFHYDPPQFAAYTAVAILAFSASYFGLRSRFARQQRIKARRIRELRRTSELLNTGISRDITERKEVEAKLAFERNQLETLFQQSPAAMVLWTGPEFIFEKVNPAYQAIFPDRELRGRPFLEACPEFKDQRFQALLAQVLETGEPFRGREVLARHADRVGGPPVDHYYDFTYMRVSDAEGKPYGVYDHAIDVTDHVKVRNKLQENQAQLQRALKAAHESEQRFRTIANHIPPLAWMTDREGYIFWYNQNWYDYTGTTFEQMQGWGWKAVHHPDHADQVTEKWLSHLKSGQPWEDTFPLKSKTGEWRWFLSRARPSYDESGQIVHWLGTNTDVTELRQAREELARANRTKDELLSICSHELRTPVASMKLSTQMFLRGLKNEDPRATSPERVHRMVEQADRQLNRLTRLIEEMLDFSRISGGKLQITPSRLDLTELMVETLAQMKPQIEGSGSQVTFDRSSAVAGDWDCFRLEQVITNLLTNALKYGARKPVRITLSQSEDTAALAIRDQGIGISPEDQARIFLPYERAVSATNISGLGLGLYISYQIIQAHHGKIEVESLPGEGSTFTVVLPKSSSPGEPP